MENDLKPCPFCGRPVETYDFEFNGGVPEKLTVRCNCGVEITCKAGAVYFDHFDGTTEAYTPWGNAFDVWNRRVTDG